MTSVEEKRSTPRYEVALAATVVVGQAPIQARIDNLSLGGARITVAMPEPARIGQRIEVSFEVPLPGSPTPLRATAEIRWINDADRDSIGVQFVTGFRPREVWALGQLLK